MLDLKKRFIIFGIRLYSECNSIFLFSNLALCLYTNIELKSFNSLFNIFLHILLIANNLFQSKYFCTEHKPTLRETQDSLEIGRAKLTKKKLPLASLSK